jgi:hypothetical protein
MFFINLLNIYRYTSESCNLQVGAVDCSETATPIFKLQGIRSTVDRIPDTQVGIYLYILESNPHPFYSFRVLKNQIPIRIMCGLDSRSRAGFWKNDRAYVLSFFRLRRWQKVDAD